VVAFEAGWLEAETSIQTKLDCLFAVEDDREQEAKAGGQTSMSVSDYFAELYVAGRFADAGWNVYFPHRDKGFDFIVSMPNVQEGQILRPVQVKGKYATAEKGDKVVYGYIGRLSQVHPEMVLAVPFFSADPSETPVCTAYMPFSLIRPHKRGYRCEPASFKSGVPVPRRDYLRFFDSNGLRLLQALSWKDSAVPPNDKSEALSTP
jgi:hypothetical protein